MSHRKPLKSYALALLLLMLATLALSSCGSSGPTTHPETKSSPLSTQRFSGPAEITSFGTQGSSADLREASAVLAENLEAREKAEFAKQCASLNAEVQSEITGAGESTQRISECPAKLEALAKPLKATAEIRKDTFDGTIDELRVRGVKAFALFHGSDGKNYSIPLERESGTWKVASIVVTEIG